MRILYLSVFFLLISNTVFAQLEGKKKSGELKLEDYKIPSFDDAPKTDEIKPTIGYKSILSKKEETYLKKFTFKKEEKVEPIMVEKDKGYDFDEDRKDKLNKKIKEAKTGNQTTQYLGEYTIETDLIKIMCRDHQEPDGDVVSILLNDVVEIKNVYLDSGYKVFYLNLKKGSNKIEFQALNQGTSGPNTAAFAIFDENDKLVTSSEWNLNTGVKASLVIMNKAADENFIKEEPKEE